MCYYRAIFRGQDRTNNSSYGEPTFTLSLPSNFFGSTVSGNVKIVLEQFEFYGQGTTSNTNPIHFVKFGLKNAFVQNEVQTWGENNSGQSQILAYIKSNDRQSDYIFYSHENNYTSYIDNALIVPSNFFQGNQLSFFMKYMNDNVINEPSLNQYKYYSFTLGVYAEETECACHKLKI